MLYTILCYNDEDVVWAWSKEEDCTIRIAADEQRHVDPCGANRCAATGNWGVAR